MIWYPYEQMKTMREPYKILDARCLSLYERSETESIRYRPGGV